MIQITVNGQKEVFQEGTLLSDVLRTRKISAGSARGIAVALNDRIVRKTDWDSRIVETGANIEIVTARQGG